MSEDKDFSDEELKEVTKKDTKLKKGKLIHILGQ